MPLHTSASPIWSQICTEKPELLLPRLRSLPPGLGSYLPLLLTRLALSELTNELTPILIEWIDQGRHLLSVARHYRLAKRPNLDQMEALFAKAVELKDERSVIELLCSVVDAYDPSDPRYKAIFRASVDWLRGRGNAEWAEHVWHMTDQLKLIAADLTASETEAVLTSLVPIPKVSHHLTWVLQPIARLQPAAVLRYIGARFDYADSQPKDYEYDAIPYDFSGFGSLAAEPQLVVDAALQWLRKSPNLRSFDVSGVVHSIFPVVSAELKTAIIDRVNTGDPSTMAAVAYVINRYEGAPPVFEICREIIAQTLSLPMSSSRSKMPWNLPALCVVRLASSKSTSATEPSSSRGLPTSVTASPLTPRLIWQVSTDALPPKRNAPTSRSPLRSFVGTRHLRTQ